MIKRFFMALALSATAIITQAQVARWLVPPVYQSIDKPAGVNLIATSLGDTTKIWSPDGTLLGATTDQLQMFQEGHSVTLKPGTQTITGFFSTDRGYISMMPCQATHDYPYFSYGYLLVQVDGVYRFIDANGRVTFDDYDMAYPFQDGQAQCVKYTNPKKKQGAEYFYIDTQGRKSKTPFPAVPNNDGSTVVTLDTKVVVVTNDQNRLLGIRYEGINVLPCQLDEVEPLGLNIAKVRKGNAWGVIAIDSEAQLIPTLNNGAPVNFRNEVARANLLLPLPVGFDADKVQISSPAGSDCAVIQQSKRIATAFGRPSVSYDCQLMLPDIMLTDTISVEYPFTVSYDGLQLPDLTVDAQLNYVNQLSINDITEGKFVGNAYSFDINVTDSRQPSPDNQPYILQVMTNRDLVSLDSISPSHYRCTVKGLMKEDNNVYIYLRELGCPMTVVTYGVTCPTRQKAVFVRKKPTSVRQIVPTPPKPRPLRPL